MDSQRTGPGPLGTFSAASEFQFPRVVRCVNVPARFQRQTQKQVQILSDNVTTVAMISGMGGSVKALDEMARSIFKVVIQCDIQISAKYIAGRDNTTADRLSRSKYEWQLHPSLFRYLDRIWGRQVHVAPISSPTGIQFIVPRSVYVRGVRTSTGLASHEQFCKRPVRVVAKGHKSAENTESNGYNHRAKVDSSTLVQRPYEPICCAANRVTSVKSDNSLYRKVRTTEKQEMSTLCLESVWATRLRCLGWSKRAATQTIHSLADSTISTYNNYIQKYVQFCEAGKVRYADNTTSAHIADFLCSISNSSERPESSLKLYIAALNMLIQNLGLQSSAQCRDIEKLVTSLVKTGTKKPMKRQHPMPIEPFMDLFMKLTLRDLRMKAITLPALCAMTRPSGLAPKGKKFNVQEQTTFTMIMKKQDVIFEKDGSMTIQFHGIKNDTNRQGFVVNISSNQENTLCDPVACLKTYIEQTDKFRTDCEALFLTLRAPYRAIRADTVGSVLEESIERAELKGVSARSFRPTGATMGVSLGVTPETVMKIGRWKTQEVFLNHYVYGKVPKDYTENLLGNAN